MSLRRRIAAAAAVAVAAVAVAIALIGYFSTRAHLSGEVKSELRSRAAQFVQAPGHGRSGGPAGGPRPPGRDHDDFEIPAGPLGGPQGVFQVVNPNGTLVLNHGLPV